MKLLSSAFLPFTDIPTLYTCEGSNQSPPLSWSDTPAETKSLVLIIEDPDAPDPEAPRMTWVHWILYNIPPSCTGLNAAEPESPDLPAGTLCGINDAKQTSYHGPCPPIGRHRYFHRLYALDTMLPVIEPATRTTLLKAMSGHILAQCELVGYYERQV